MASTVSNGNDRLRKGNLRRRDDKSSVKGVSQGGDDFCFVVNAPLKLTLVICSVAWGRATVAFTMVCCTFASRKSCDLTGCLNFPHNSWFTRGTFNFS